MSRPITAQLVGGLGNQLFTYYAAAALAAKRSVPLRIDPSRSAHGVSAQVFNLPGEWLPDRADGTSHGRRHSLVSRLTRRITRQVPALGGLLRYYESREPGEDPHLLEQGPGTTIRGYFQSWKTVEAAYRLGAKKELSLKSPSDWLVTAQQQAAVEDPIAVHVRRGDYASSGVFGLLSAEYYGEALERLRRRGLRGPIWLFSDDPEVAVEIIDAPCEVMASPVGPQEELLAMSRAAAFVTANSSFSWWGAWLSGSKHVVAPGEWFKESPEPAGLVPPWWTRISSRWD
jgi:hypothetical protein